MAKQPDINDISTIYNSANIINSNFDNVRESFLNTLSIDGSTPNQMEADLDLGGNDLLNVGTLWSGGEDLIDLLNTADSAAYGDIRLPGDHFYSGNVFQGGGASGFAIHTDGSNSVISNNDLSQSTASLKLISVAACKVFGNVGYVQKSDGSVTISNPSTSITVAHGLDEDPSTIGKPTLTMRSDGSGVTRAWVGAVDATNITIETNAAPSSSIDLDWQLSTERD